uniref:SHSP domain-containing protein n=1 Tax=Globodera rostochiensis TaxID=31243 RepID=A0A914ICN0_GLORO
MFGRIFPAIHSLHVTSSILAMALQQMAANRSICSTSVRRSFFRDPADLWLYDPFRPMRRMLRRPLDPFATLDHFLDDQFVPQIRDNSAKLGVDDLGNFTYSVDTSGFRPEELNVSIEGDELVVHGEHKQEAANGETVHRQFVRRVLIPEGFQKEGLKCELDDSGRMCVTAPKAGVEPAPERRSIPIDVKAKAAAIGESKN